MSEPIPQAIEKKRSEAVELPLDGLVMCYTHLSLKPRKAEISCKVTQPSGVFKPVPMRQDRIHKSAWM